MEVATTNLYATAVSISVKVRPSRSAVPRREPSASRTPMVSAVKNASSPMGSTTLVTYLREEGVDGGGGHGAGDRGGGGEGR